jgi:hypothetical protein
VLPSSLLVCKPSIPHILCLHFYSPKLHPTRNTPSFNIPQQAPQFLPQTNLNNQPTTSPNDLTLSSSSTRHLNIYRLTTGSGPTLPGYTLSATSTIFAHSSSVFSSDTLAANVYSQTKLGMVQLTRTSALCGVLVARQ